MANKGTLFIIPSYLSEKNDASFIAPMVLDVIKNTSHYLVENVRTSRRFISS
ncbi:MAG: 16S rRNA (cytidine1402-2'-O)-methyltransferase, partial [Cyclobacteriaceae bacterium]